MPNLHLYTRGMIKYYEEYRALLPAGQRGIDEFLFDTRDATLESDVRLDEFIHQPYAAVYRNKDNQAHIRPYKAGSGKLFEVPRISEKTAIGEDLSDSLVAGMENNSRQAVNFRSMLRHITNQHISTHNMTKWKQAINVIMEGKFEARGVDGQDIGLDIDFGRNTTNSIMVDFSTAKMNDALIEMHQQMDVARASKQNRIVIFGSSWLKQWGGDSDVINFLDANNANTLLMQAMQVSELNNIHGLYPLARYRVPGHPSAVWICDFSPKTQYYPTEDGMPEPFIPDDTAIMFVMGDQRWKVLRGMDVIGGSGRRERQVGEIVFDSYIENDPLTDFVRSHSRHLYLPANINHTVKSVGTNFS